MGGPTNMAVPATSSDRFNVIYRSDDTISNAAVTGYKGTCTYGDNSKEATFCPEEPAISLSADAMADGNKFTVTCDFKSCEHTKLVKGDDTEGLNLNNGAYVETDGVLTETNYTCMNGDKMMKTVTVECLANMTITDSVGGVCEDTLKPIICTKDANNEYTKSCEEKDAAKTDAVCRCPASTPYYHIADGTCQEKCGAQGMFVSLFLIIAAVLRFL